MRRGDLAHEPAVAGYPDLMLNPIDREAQKLGNEMSTVVGVQRATRRAVVFGYRAVTLSHAERPVR